MEPVFDLDRGRVSLGSDPHVLVPASALLALCRAAGDRAARELGRATGESIGRRLASRGEPGEAAFTDAIDALGAELGWLGLGSLVAERWGELLMFRLDAAPAGAADEVDPLLSGILEGAIEAWTGRTAHAVVVERGAERVRVLVGGPRAVGVAQALMHAGVDLHEIVRRLHAEGAPSQGPP